MNQSPHQVDLFWWFLGLPSRVHGFAGFGKYHDIEVEDEVSAFFEYPDGKIGHFITSTSENPGTNRLEISAEMGRLVVEGETITFRRNEQSALRFIRAGTGAFEKLASTETVIAVPREEGSPHRVVLANFADAVLNGAPLVAPAAEGIYSVMMANAVILSALKGSPVDLPMDGAEFASLLAGKTEDAAAR